MILHNKEILWEVIKSWLNTPYYWGGDDPTGVDCSGFVQEMLWSVGKIDDNVDRTAGGQRAYWAERGKLHDNFPGVSKSVIGTVNAPESVFGWPVFFRAKDNEKIIHVELCLTAKLSVGARGDSSVKGVNALEVAKRKNAYVKIRPIQGRTNMRFAGIANPW